MEDLNKLDVFKELQKELEEPKKKQQYFFCDDTITITLDVNNWLYIDWIGYQTEKSVMVGCEKILEALQHYNVSQVLNDNTRMVGIWTPAAEWVGANWLPRMKAAGLKQFAWVYSPSRMGQVSTDIAIKNTPFADLIRTVQSKGEAWQWLLSSE